MNEYERKVKSMKKIKDYHHKHTRYVAMILLFIILFIYIGIYQVTNDMIKQIKDTAYDYLMSTTEIIESKVNSSLEKDIKKLDYLAESILLDDHTLKYALKEFNKNNELYSTFYLDQSGKGINQNYHKLDKSYIKVEETALSKGKSGVSKAFMNDAGDMLILVQTPVYRNGIQMGALYCEIMIQHYYTNELFAFQEGKGRTFIVNSDDGSWLLKSPASEMIKINDENLYTTMEDNGNSQKTLNELKDSIAHQKTGVFEVKGKEDTLMLCTTPIHTMKNWQMITMVHDDLFANQIKHIKWNSLLMIALSIIVLFTFVALIALIINYKKRKYKMEIKQQFNKEKDAVDAMNREIIMRNCDFCVRVDLDEKTCDVMIYHKTNVKAQVFHDAYDIALKAYGKEIYLDDVDDFMNAFTLSALEKTYQNHDHQKHVNYRIMADETLWYECYTVCYYLQDHRYVYMLHRNITQEMKEQMQLIQVKYHEKGRM